MGPGGARRALRARVRRAGDSRRRRGCSNVGDGLKVTQIRLGTARLTHCMRWLGLARRSLAIALDYVARAREPRRASSPTRESVQALLGEAAMQIEIGRLLTMRAAAKLDARRLRAQGDLDGEGRRRRRAAPGGRHRRSSCTARAATRRTRVLEWIYRYARQARLVDGASEVHKMVLARFLLEERERSGRGTRRNSVPPPLRRGRALFRDDRALGGLLAVLADERIAARLQRTDHQGPR